MKIKQAMRRSSVRLALIFGSVVLGTSCASDGDDDTSGTGGKGGTTGTYPYGGSAGRPAAAPSGSLCTSEASCRGRDLPRCAEAMLTTCDTERARWECVYRRKISPDCACYVGEVRLCQTGGATGAGGKTSLGGTTSVGGAAPLGGAGGAGGSAGGRRSFQVCAATGGTRTTWGACE